LSIGEGSRRCRRRNSFHSFSLLKLQLKLTKCDMVPDERAEDEVNCSVPRLYRLIANPGIEVWS
jgi:hypothetical protein